jgi:hypothetical protein
VPDGRQFAPDVPYAGWNCAPSRTFVFEHEDRSWSATEATKGQREEDRTLLGHRVHFRSGCGPQRGRGHLRQNRGKKGNEGHRRAPAKAGVQAQTRKTARFADIFWPGLDSCLRRRTAVRWLILAPMPVRGVPRLRHKRRTIVGKTSEFCEFHHLRNVFWRASSPTRGEEGARLLLPCIPQPVGRADGKWCAIRSSWSGPC